MGSTFEGDRFGGSYRGQGSGWPGAGGQGIPGGLWEGLEQLRSMFDVRVPGPTRMGRGDVRAAVLALLAEQPMHGYQIIREIEDRSGGSWKLSPGSVYPTLQLLADEGLIRAEESNGRKVYSLTDEGRVQSEAAADKPAPWESSSKSDAPGHGGLAKAGMDLAQAAAQVGRTGSPEQVKQAVAVLDDARRKLYSILAQD